MDIKKAMEGISQEDFEKAAESAGISVEELKEKYKAALMARTSVATAANSDCNRRDFKISIFDIIGVGGFIEFCGTADKWSADLHVCLIAAGAEVWCADYKLNNDEASVTIGPNVGIAKADLTIGIRGPNACFFVGGEACVWAIGWTCGTMDRTDLFCFA
jgi:hypothetical protein